MPTITLHKVSANRKILYGSPKTQEMACSGENLLKIASFVDMQQIAVCYWTANLVIYEYHHHHQFF